MNESNLETPPTLYDDEIDLVEVFRVLWKGKWLIGPTWGAAVLFWTLLIVLQALCLMTGEPSDEFIYFQF